MYLKSCSEFLPSRHKLWGPVSYARASELISKIHRVTEATFELTESQSFCDVLTFQGAHLQVSCLSRHARASELISKYLRSCLSLQMNVQVLFEMLRSCPTGRAPDIVSEVSELLSSSPRSHLELMRTCLIYKAHVWVTEASSKCSVSLWSGQESLI